MQATITRAVRAHKPGQAGHGELLGFIDVLPTLRELLHRPDGEGARIIAMHLATDWIHTPHKRMREGYGYQATALWTANTREQLRTMAMPHKFTEARALPADPQDEGGRLPLMGVLLVALLPVLGFLAGLAMGAWVHLQRVPAHLWASLGVGLGAVVVVLGLVRVALEGMDRKPVKMGCAEGASDKDPRGCWNVRCQLGLACCRQRGHGMPRDEWVRRFQARIRERTGMDAPGTDWMPGAAASVVQAELGSWPEDPASDEWSAGDWREELPEDAADDNLSAWTE